MPKPSKVYEKYCEYAEKLYEERSVSAARDSLAILDFVAVGECNCGRLPSVSFEIDLGDKDWFTQISHTITCYHCGKKVVRRNLLDAIKVWKTRMRFVLTPPNFDGFEVDSDEKCD